MLYIVYIFRVLERFLEFVFRFEFFGFNFLIFFFEVFRFEFFMFIFFIFFFLIVEILIGCFVGGYSELGILEVFKIL